MSENQNLAQQEIAPYEVLPQPVEKKSKRSAVFFRLIATRRVTYMALLTALAVVTKMFMIELPAAKISLFYIPCYLSGAFFGPAYGFMTGVLGDLIGYIAKGGTPNPMITLGNGLAGFIVGVAFYIPKLRPKIKLIIGAYASMFICTLGINTAALAIMSGSQQFTFWQNYLAQLWFGAIPRVILQPLVITANLVIAVGLYYAVSRYLNKVFVRDK